MTKAKAKNRVDRAQRTRFIKAARNAECSEDEAEIDRNLKWIAKLKAPGSKKALKTEGVDPAGSPDE